MADPKTSVQIVAGEAVKQGISAPHPAQTLTEEERAALDLGATLDLFGEHQVKPPKLNGRPPGRVPHATQALRKLLIARGYRDPAEFLAAIYSMPTKELAAELHCDTKDAMPHQIRAAVELLPYFHQKSPMALEVTQQTLRPVMIINEVHHHAGASETDDGAMSVHDLEAEQYQEVSEDGAEATHEPDAQTPAK